ncbi:MAG: ribonuclease H-like domain-containing protein [Nitrososphaerales archaeon]
MIDFETTGFPWHNGCEVVTLGYFSGNDVVITQRKTKDKIPFHKEISQILDGLHRPFYSYNTSFEKSVMKNVLGMDIRDGSLVDIMKPWKEKAEGKRLKWPKLDELISEPGDYFNDRKISGKDIPRLWGIYTKTGIESALTRIMEHCFSDMLREAILLLRYEQK